jgi:ribonuclease J
VHVSGHASQGELQFMLGLVDPEWFIPVHGEYRHLVHHAALAEEMGVKPDHVLVCEDGDAVTIDDTTLDVERRAVPAGYQYVDGIAGDISHGVLRDRRSLAEEGFVVVIVTVDAGTGEVVTGPEIVTRGWVYEAEADELLEDAKAAVRAALTQAADDGPVEFDALRRKARRALGKLINERTRRRPAVIPVIMEV